MKKEIDYGVDICPGCTTYVFNVQASSPKEAFTKAVTSWLEQTPADYFIGMLDVHVYEKADDWPEP